MGGQCVVCNHEAARSCSNCKQVYYCNRDHQAQHWKLHRIDCQPFRVDSEQDRGRFLVATRKIPAGSVLFQEDPVAVGPFKSQNFSLVCIACYLPLNNLNTRCSKCNIPLCSKSCQTKGDHQIECPVMEKVQDLKDQETPFQDWNLILPIRVLLLKHSDPAKYKALNNLVSNRSQKETSADWPELLTSTKQIRDKYLTDFDEDEIIDVLCILDSNAYQVLSKLTFETMSGLYPRAAMLNHACRSNTRPVVTSQFKMKVVTTEVIEKGMEIYASYVPPLYTTLQRRAILQRGKFFDCSCARCSDPTEFGSHSSAIKCHSEGCQGYLVSANPLGITSEWICSDCQTRLDPKTAIHLDKKLSEEARKLELQPNCGLSSYQKFFDAYQPYLHPNHAFLCLMEQKMCERIGRVQDMNATNMNVDDWTRKITMARHLLLVYNKIEAPLSLLTGLISLELGEALMALHKFSEAKQFLENAVEIFKHEDPSSPDGQLWQKANTLMEVVSHAHPV